MKIELAVFTKDNKVLEIANDDNLEEVVEKILKDYDFSVDDFSDCPEQTFVFLQEKGINSSLIKLDILEDS